MANMGEPYFWYNNIQDNKYKYLFVDDIFLHSQPMISESASVKVYKIRNIQTNQYWSNGKWNKNGKVWIRMSDVKNVLNHMSTTNFTKCEIVDHILVSQSTLHQLMTQVIDVGEDSMEQEIEKLFNKNS